MTIHKTAIIAETAIIPESCEIGPYVVVGEDVKLGENVKILANAYLEYCEIGDNTTIYPFASIGTAPQDLSYHGQKTKAVIGKNCTIKEYVTINRGAGEEGSVTKVGNNCLFMASAHIAHNCVVEDEAIFANLATIGGHVHVGKGAFLGGMSVFHQNVRIGEYVIISGFSGARMDIPPFAKVAGAPAVLHGANVVGLRRRGFSKEEILNIREAYRLIQARTTTMTNVLKTLQEKYSNDEKVMRIVNFIKESKRGIYLGRTSSAVSEEV